MKYYSEETIKRLLENKVYHTLKECPSIELGWHTGTPTEEGQYFVAYRWGLDNKIMHDMASQICYGATTFFNGTWKIEYPFIVIAWQRIEPYKEAST